MNISSSELKIVVGYLIGYQVVMINVALCEVKVVK